MLECEQSAAKQETASTLAVKAETKEEEESAFRVPCCASAAGNEELLGQNREATPLTSVRGEDHEEAELNNPSDALQDTQFDNIVSCFYTCH